MNARISSTVLATIRQLAADAPDREVCGLLLGAGDVVTACRPAPNVAPDPARHFEIDPAALIAAYRAARHGGDAVLGHYHSHPSGICAPSARDAESACADGALWIIVTARELGAWRAGQSGLHGRFTPVMLTEIDDPALASPAAGRQ